MCASFYWKALRSCQRGAHVLGKGVCGPKRINLEKIGPNHEFPTILMKTHRMESWQERGGVTTQLAGHSSLNLEGRNQSRI